MRKKYHPAGLSQVCREPDLSIFLAFFQTLKFHSHWQVRPFTLGQLKELLGRTGTLVEEAFWIDKIKSHCFVTVRGRSWFSRLCPISPSVARVGRFEALWQWEGGKACCDLLPLPSSSVLDSGGSSCHPHSSAWGQMAPVQPQIPLC